MNVRKRYIHIDPTEGVLMRFKTAYDFPHKPNEIIPLRTITSIAPIERSWMMDSDYEYFEVIILNYLLKDKFNLN